ncbi:MAG: 4-(cytidine 5'-diphospho)-2-C-methyl-D-erythritol kinase [Deltaproteobacteria bacterium]|nr:4-(cytidine 5'-diphospho)-2-C-methyl-D-erythritol kinase [Deltaproteobacteria bacterium]
MTKTGIKLKAPAKVNVRLEITGKRPDGYHEIFSIFVPVELYDKLYIGHNNTGLISFKSKGLDVPQDPANLVYRAADSFFKKTGIKNSGVDIELEKNIPVAAGLGGGSSDAASTLLGLNKLYNLPINKEDLHKIALKLGADVPFFLDAVPSIVTGIGEILEPIPNWPELWYLIITPKLEISTAWVYQNYKMELTSNEYDYIRKTLKNDDVIVSSIVKNDLEKVTSTSFPIINTLKRKIMDAGAEAAIMSGSGPSVFGIFLSREKAVSARNLLMSDNVRHISVVKGKGIKKAV